MQQPEPRRGPAPVLVEDQIELNCPFGAIGPLLSEDDRWLAGLVGEAEEDGDTTIIKMGPAWASARLHREVRASIGAWRPVGNTLVGWIRWEAIEHRELFPVLDGDLVLSPKGDHSHLTLRASYVPPFGALGRGLDWAGMHRVAEATLHSFLFRLAARLEDLDCTNARVASPPGRETGSEG
ncbi:MAG: hypothetical protein M0014_15300 [Actinomycetota bacterium]|jgi:hypothetical protein|nr:hypothetical protein [Actinomycetota bacterium]